MKKQWAMEQTWTDLVFLHWPVPAEALRPFIPEELALDTWEGQAWIGVVPFVADKTRPHFLLPVPGAKRYRELNVRTYVRYGNRSGVYFFSLDADSLLAVQAASIGEFLPYRYAAMKFIRKGERRLFISSYKGDDGRESFRLGYEPISGIIQASPFECFLTERYCLWTKPRNTLWRVDIAHSPWKLQHVHYELSENSLAGYLPALFKGMPAYAHFSAFKEVRFYPPVAENRKNPAA